MTPAGSAASCFLLAKNTGWSMETILWEIPVAWLNQAEHVFLWADGAKLRRPGRANRSDLRDMERILGL